MNNLEIRQLGDCLGVHPTDKGRQIRKIVWGLLMAGMGLFVLIPVMASNGMIPNALLHPSFPVLRIQGNDIISIAGFILMVFVMLPYGLWLILSSVEYLWWLPRIEIYSEGVRVSSRRRQEQWRWAKFDTLRMKVEFVKGFGESGSYELYADGSRVMTVDYDYEHTRELHDLLLYKTGEMLWPRYAEAFERGETLKFGKDIQLNHRGIQHRKRFFRWYNLDDWDVPALLPNNLILYHRNGLLAINARVAGVPNAHILLMIVDSMLRPEPGDEQSSAASPRKLPPVFPYLSSRVPYSPDNH